MKWSWVLFGSTKEACTHKSPSWWKTIPPRQKHQGRLLRLYSQYTKLEREQANPFVGYQFLTCKAGNTVHQPSSLLLWEKTLQIHIHRHKFSGETPKDCWNQSYKNKWGHWTADIQLSRTNNFTVKNIPEASSTNDQNSCLGVRSVKAEQVHTYNPSGYEYVTIAHCHQIELRKQVEIELLTNEETTQEHAVIVEWVIYATS